MSEPLNFKLEKIFKKSLKTEADMLKRRREMRAAGKTVIIPEDDPNVYKQALHKKSVKVKFFLKSNICPFRLLNHHKSFNKFTYKLSGNCFQI